MLLQAQILQIMYYYLFIHRRKTIERRCFVDKTTVENLCCVQRMKLIGNLLRSVGNTSQATSPALQSYI